MKTNKFFSLVVFFAYLMGSIGGFGYAVYSNAYLIATAVAALSVMAFPVFRKHVINLID